MKFVGRFGNKMAVNHKRYANKIVILNFTAAQIIQILSGSYITVGKKNKSNDQ